MVKLTLYHGDALEILKTFPDKSVDLIITDPPYGINYHSNHGSSEYKAKVHFDNSWDKDFNFEPFYTELWRVLKDNAHMYVFGTWKNYDLMTRLDGFKQVLIWDKMSPGMGDLTSWGIGYELIFWFEKGKRPVNFRKSPVLRVESLSSFSHGKQSELYLHPTQKPVDIITPLIEVSSNPGEIVLDAFMGSGTTGVASIQLNRSFIGIEINDVYYQRAKKRLVDYANSFNVFNLKQIEFEFVERGENQ